MGVAIANFKWGEIVDATGRRFKDARLSPTLVEEWDWGRTGTRHRPGIQIADLEDLVIGSPDVIILSRGVDLVLQVPDVTVAWARIRCPDVRVLQSAEAVAAYNASVATGANAVALIHSTC